MAGMEQAPATEGAPAIAVAGLRKVYRRTTALHDLSLTVGRGEVFGFLGPNGAGKTTAMKILLGLAHPSAGEARIFGHPVQRRAARQEVGYLPEHFRFHDWLTGEALLDLHGRLAGLDADERRARIPEALERVGLTGRGGERLRGYSKGMTQRLGLAQALIGRPRLVLLDEPTSALDPGGRRTVREVIRDLRTQGTTVFLNSHLLSEVEMVCDRVAVVDRGRVVRAGPLDELLAGSPEVRVTLDRVDEAVMAELARFGQVDGVDATTVTVAVDDAGRAPDIAQAIVQAGYRLHALVPVRRSLEDVFVGLVQGGDR